MGNPIGLSLREQIAAAADELREYQKDLWAAGQSMAEATVSKRSKDRTLTVELTAGNILREIKFHGTTYRTMAPAELGTVLIETINAAQRELGDKMRDALSPFGGFGAKLRESLTGGTELDDAMKSVRALLEPSKADSTWEQETRHG
jgi:hypothetical protein